MVFAETIFELLDCFSFGFYSILQLSENRQAYD